MHVLNVMSPSRGHATTMFDPSKLEDVEAVRAEFDSMISKGYLGFADGLPTVTFDPQARETLVTPLVVAG